MHKVENPRRELLAVRLSAGELQTVAALAARDCLSIPDFVRQRVLPSGAELRPGYRLRRNGVDAMPDP